MIAAVRYSIPKLPRNKYDSVNSYSYTSGGTLITNNSGGGSAGGSDVDLSGYATIDWVNALINDKGYATETFVTSQGYITNSALNGYATQSWVESKGYITNSALNGYATESWVEGKGYATETYIDNQIKLHDSSIKNYINMQGFLTEEEMDKCFSKTIKELTIGNAVRFVNDVSFYCDVNFTGNINGVPVEDVFGNRLHRNLYLDEGVIKRTNIEFDFSADTNPNTQILPGLILYNKPNANYQDGAISPTLTYPDLPFLTTNVKRNYWRSVTPGEYDGPNEDYYTEVSIQDKLYVPDLEVRNTLKVQNLQVDDFDLGDVDLNVRDINATGEIYTDSDIRTQDSLYVNKNAEIGDTLYVNKIILQGQNPIIQGANFDSLSVDGITAKTFNSQYVKLKDYYVKISHHYDTTTAQYLYQDHVYDGNLSTADIYKLERPCFNIENNLTFTGYDSFNNDNKNDQDAILKIGYHRWYNYHGAGIVEYPIGNGAYNRVNYPNGYWMPSEVASKAVLVNGELIVKETMQLYGDVWYKGKNVTNVFDKSFEVVDRHDFTNVGYKKERNVMYFIIDDSEWESRPEFPDDPNEYYN